MDVWAQNKEYLKEQARKLSLGLLKLLCRVTGPESENSEEAALGSPVQGPPLLRTRLSVQGHVR